MFERRQRKLTTTMGISCILTVVFYVTPMSARYLYKGKVDSAIFSFLTMYSGISCNFNPLVIIGALLIMQEDVKAAVLNSLPLYLKRLIKRQLPKFVPATSMPDQSIANSAMVRQKTVTVVPFLSVGHKVSTQPNLKQTATAGVAKQPVQSRSISPDFQKH